MMPTPRIGKNSFVHAAMTRSKGKIAIADHSKGIRKAKHKAMITSMMLNSVKNMLPVTL